MTNDSAEADGRLIASHASVDEGEAPRATFTLRVGGVFVEGAVMFDAGELSERGQGRVEHARRIGGALVHDY